MTRYRYADIDLLAADVKRVSTQAQREKIEKFEATGWYIYSAKAQGSTVIVFMSHKDSTGPAAVYPDGVFERAVKGRKSISYNWTRAHAARETINA